MALQRSKRAGCSPVVPVLTLLACVLFIVVYFTALNVGNTSMESRRNKKLELTAHIIQMKSERYSQCQLRVELLKNGQTTLAQAKETVEGNRRNLETELELLQSRNELVSQEVRECKHEKNLMEKQSGPPVATQRPPFAGEERQRYMEAIAVIKGGSRVGRQHGPELLRALIREVERQRKRWSEKAPLVSECRSADTRYSVVLDAGSTGSRVHVFRYNITTDPSDITSRTSLLPFLRLDDELFVANHLPLAKFDNVQDAAASLTELLDVAKSYIPHSMHACTPIELKATSGLRRVGKDRVRLVLDAVRRHLQLWPFWLQRETDSVRILEGREEGPMAWLTVNYLRGALGGNGTRTATVLDLGGGSTQIVFHPDNEMVLKDKTNFAYEFLINGGTHVLYQHSYEGNGLHAAKGQLLRAVVAAQPSSQETLKNTASTNNVGGKSDRNTVVDAFPCFPKGYIHKESSVSNVRDGGVSPSMEACAELFRKYVVRKNETCGSTTCGFNGVFQPDLKTVSGVPVYAFSYYYDLLKPHMTGEVITVGGVADIASQVCGRMKSLEKMKNNTAKQEVGDLKEEMQCLELSYIFALLSHGFGFSKEQQLHIAKKINGFETSWALGVSLLTVGGK